MLTIARTLDEAGRAAGEIRAGGTDVTDRRRHGLAAGPVVDIGRLPDLDQIEWGDDGAAALGALLTVAAVAGDGRLAAGYPGLAQAAGGLATPQIRTMATLGGALLQRTRCPYFRHPAFSCFKSGGEGCPAREGHLENGVVFDLGACVYPHPSTLGMALLAYEAEVEVGRGERRPLAALYGDGSDPARDHLLADGEILTRIVLPPPAAGERAAYVRAISRAEAEWPIVEALARLVVVDGKITLARVGAGGVANIPLRLPAVEEALLGESLTNETFAAAAETVRGAAAPLPQTAHKVDFLVHTLQEALERAAG